MGTPIKVGNRNNRGGAIRGITSQAPQGWSPPESAERLASFAKAMGWEVNTGWFEADGQTCLKVELGRVLRPGDSRATTTKGDRWLYRLIWEEIPETDRPNLHHSRMRIAVNRALTPNTGQWREGPSIKGIADILARHPASKKPQMAVKAIRMQARARTMAL
jgi:hypothetical protein